MSGLKDVLTDAQSRIRQFDVTTRETLDSNGLRDTQTTEIQASRTWKVASIKGAVDLAGISPSVIGQTGSGIFSISLSEVINSVGDYFIARVGKTTSYSVVQENPVTNDFFVDEQCRIECAVKFRGGGGSFTSNRPSFSPNARYHTSAVNVSVNRVSGFSNTRVFRFDIFGPLGFSGTGNQDDGFNTASKSYSTTKSTLFLAYSRSLPTSVSAANVGVYLVGQQ